MFIGHLYVYDWLDRKMQNFLVLKMGCNLPMEERVLVTRNL